jgi:hypothetical protein
VDELPVGQFHEEDQVLVAVQDMGVGIDPNGLFYFALPGILVKRRHPRESAVVGPPLRPR